MIFGKTKLELKVGTFVFIGLIVLVIFVLSIGGFKTWSSGYKVNLIFNFANGVRIGAPVRFAGVDVGVVKNINLQFNPDKDHSDVRLEVWIRDTVKIPVDSTVWINTLGLLGEKYVEVMPGKDSAHILKANQDLAGIDPVPTHELFSKAEAIMGNLDNGIAKIVNKEGTLGRLLYDEKIYNELEALVTDVRKNPWKLLIKTKEKK
ncbi:MAG TPA: MlaD family protein [Candidatus Omnitrophota bacterium]|nr:MlaD family protein [Candidatus Omnitrophota bacterium]HPT39502.1 MlaD family protein [Candidatus Omnitrophota bacterium]